MGAAGKVLDIAADEVPESTVTTRIHVIAGGPCSGKTTLLEALADAGYDTERETAEELLKAGLAAGRSSEQLRADRIGWQERLFGADFALFSRLARGGPVFTDTSFIETLVFTQRAGITVGPNTERWIGRMRYAAVFFLEPLRTYQRTAVRREDAQTAAAIGDEVHASYRRFGYQPVAVAAGPVADWVAFIRDSLSATDRQTP